MNVRKSLVRLVALTVVVTMPVMGMAGIASAKAPKKGSLAWCNAHPTAAKKVKSCPQYTGNAGGGSGIGTEPITVTESPGSAGDPGGVPLVETGASEVATVIQVETDDRLANASVVISSSQLVQSCLGGTAFISEAPSPTGTVGVTNITVPLDDDGNATVLAAGIDCAPGTDLIEADLTTAPYYTAIDTMTVAPPHTTTPGLTGYPNNEVETGDDAALNGLSDVYAVFYVEDSPVYAEQTAEIGSSQLEARCGNGWEWIGLNGPNNTVAASVPPPPNAVNFGPNTGAEATSTIDDDGNAAFVFIGASCAAGDSEVIADIESGTHDTWPFDYTIDPPAVTI